MTTISKKQELTAENQKISIDIDTYNLIKMYLSMNMHGRKLVNDLVYNMLSNPMNTEKIGFQESKLAKEGNMLKYEFNK